MLSEVQIFISFDDSHAPMKLNTSSIHETLILLSWTIGCSPGIYNMKAKQWSYDFYLFPKEWFLLASKTKQAFK